jgi:alkanesulfonate monooxygenase SsuD/methylene tetrahydromethanopterin reductase-like flavin-dependent oxidoreductase (luciferase family)
VIEIVLRAWRGEPFAHAGEQHAIPETTCHPSPMADPHPILWLANEVRVPDSLPLERHGRIVGMTTDQREAAQSETRREHGRTPRAMARLLVIGERHAEARAIATEAVERMLDRPLRRDEGVSDFAIAGDGRACCEQVAELREAHAPEVLVVVPSAQSAGEGQRRFAEEVIPNLEGLYAAVPKTSRMVSRLSRTRSGATPICGA